MSGRNETMKNRRVAITGMGIICGAGAGREAFGDALLSTPMKSCVEYVKFFDASRATSKLAAEVPEFDIKEYIETEKGYLDRTTELAFAGTSLALEDANLSRQDIQKAGAGLFLGTAFGNHGTIAAFLDDLFAKGPRFVKPVLFPHAYSNTTISMLAMEYGLNGWHVNFSSGGISGAAAILNAFDLIRLGRLDMALAGGVDSPTGMVFLGLDHRKLLSASPCRPFDANRDGFNPGEACAVVVMEEMSHAVARGARIMAEMLGGGFHSMLPEAAAGIQDNAVYRAMKSALASHGKAADLIIASANGSRIRDEIEWKAIAALAAEVGDLRVTSVKSILGETFGAEGPLQVATAIECMLSGTIPPTLNLDRQLDTPPLPIVTGEPASLRCKLGLVNSFDDGGSAISILMGYPS